MCVIILQLSGGRQAKLGKCPNEGGNLERRDTIDDISTSIETGVLSDSTTLYLELSGPCDVLLVGGVEEVWPRKVGVNGEQQSSSG
ncbi:hypothetical protein TNCV_3229511 [Trichonephila clavipes]|nr:hypothetical protein TNCV_3229511 [Trichonephila clavipes]